MYCRAASVSRIFAHSVCHKLLKSVAAMAAISYGPVYLGCMKEIHNSCKELHTIEILFYY